MGKKTVVVGLGVTGLWVVRYLSGQGNAVIVSEMRSEGELDQARCEEVRALGAVLETEGHREKTFLDAGRIVLSPGVPHDSPLLQEVRKRAVPVVGELEMASRLTKTPLIAVTGTNGKSTVTELAGRLLQNAGCEVFVGGNLGTPLTAYVAEGGRADYAVVEVSSFQLDTIEKFRPLVSVLLNVSPDHLDRYEDYEAYVASKLRIYENQRAGQYAILNDADPRLSKAAPRPGPTVLRYGPDRAQGRHAFVEEGRIRAHVGDTEWDLPLGAVRIPGKHNVENVLAVVLIALALNIDAGVVEDTLKGFSGLPHRLEFVEEVEGRAFYDDSKATNVDAAVRAVASFDRPVILIAGGRHKGADYAPLVEACRGRARGAVFLGESSGLLAKAFDRAVPFSLAKDMEEAVSVAFSRSRTGDVVLLAPACSSFDMFADYAHRGRVFHEAVRRLIHEQGLEPRPV